MRVVSVRGSLLPTVRTFAPDVCARRHRVRWTNPERWIHVPSDSVEGAVAEGLTEARALELFERIAELHRQKDPDRITEVYTEDVAVDDDGGTAPVRGAEDMREFLMSVWRAFPDFGVEIVEGPFLGAGGFAVRGRIFGTMTGPLSPPGLAPTGTRMEAEFGGFYVPEGDRLRRVRVIMNAREIATQLGTLPAPGSPAERAGLVLQRATAAWMRRRAG